MKIELKTMTLQNFKKERSKTINFAHNTIISGGNETGKSTAYDVHLWCLFGTTSRPDATVQTLDKHNNVIERTYKLEELTAVQEEQIKVANHRIEDLEKKQ